MSSQKLCIFLFLYDLFAVCGFSQGASHGWLCTCTILYLWVNHKNADESVDGYDQFGLQDLNGRRLQVQH
jgi:hypothetical protein